MKIEKQKVNLIYKLFKKSLIFYCAGKEMEIKTILRASKASFRQICKVLSYTTVGKDLFRSYLLYPPRQNKTHVMGGK